MDRYYSLEQIKSAIKVTHEKYGGISEEFDLYKLMQMPTADVQPVKRGHWMHDSTGANFCSECGMYPYDDGEYHMIWHTKFCPNCGARMEERDDADT